MTFGEMAGLRITHVFGLGACKLKLIMDGWLARLLDVCRYVRLGTVFGCVGGNTNLPSGHELLKGLYLCLAFTPCFGVSCCFCSFFQRVSPFGPLID